MRSDDSPLFIIGYRGALLRVFDITSHDDTILAPSYWQYGLWYAAARHGSASSTRQRHDTFPMKLPAMAMVGKIAGRLFFIRFLMGYWVRARLR